MMHGQKNIKLYHVRLHK